MSDNDTFEEAVHSWFAEYFAEGRSKQQLIRYLRDMQCCSHPLISHRHLENPRKKFLGKTTKINIELRDQEIISIFTSDPKRFSFLRQTVYPEHPAAAGRIKAMTKKSRK